MTKEFVVLDIFRLPDKSIVLACEGAAGHIRAGFAQLASPGGAARQKVELIGERTMLSQSLGSSHLRALEIRNDVILTSEEARSGQWRLICDE